jgi:hypothetical protein
MIIVARVEESMDAEKVKETIMGIWGKDVEVIVEHVDSRDNIVKTGSTPGVVVGDNDTAFTDAAVAALTEDRIREILDPCPGEPPAKIKVEPVPYDGVIMILGKPSGTAATNDGIIMRLADVMSLDGERLSLLAPASTIKIMAYATLFKIHGWRVSNAVQVRTSGVSLADVHMGEMETPGQEEAEAEAEAEADDQNRENRKASVGGDGHTVHPGDEECKGDNPLCEGCC